MRVLCLVLTLSAVTLISCQTVEKEPSECSPYVNESSLFTNENASFNQIILGFQEETWQPYEIQTFSPCVSLEDTAGTQLFVQVETSTNDELCIEIGATSNCGTGEVELCADSEATGSETEYVYFTCQSSCSTNSVAFLYRIIQSANSGNLEYWCGDIAAEPNDKYPKDVQREQAGGTAVSFTVTFQQTPEPQGGGSVLSLSSLSLVLALLVCLLLV